MDIYGKQIDKTIMKSGYEWKWILSFYDEFLEKGYASSKVKAKSDAHKAMQKQQKRLFKENEYEIEEKIDWRTE